MTCLSPNFRGYSVPVGVLPDVSFVGVPTVSPTIAGHPTAVMLLLSLMLSFLLLLAFMLLLYSLHLLA